MKNKTTIVLSDASTDKIKALASGENLSVSEYIEILLSEVKPKLKSYLLLNTENTQAAAQVIAKWHQQANENRTELKCRVMMEYTYFCLFDLCEISEEKLRDKSDYFISKLPEPKKLPELAPYYEKCANRSITIDEFEAMFRLFARLDTVNKYCTSYFIPRVWEVALRDCATWRYATAVTDNYKRLSVYIDRIF